MQRPALGVTLWAGKCLSRSLTPFTLRFMPAGSCRRPPPRPKGRGDAAAVPACYAPSPHAPAMDADACTSSGTAA